MMDKHQAWVEKATMDIALPADVKVRAWTDTDFPAIQQLSTVEGWPTPVKRPDEALIAWQKSWPTLVVVNRNEVIGFLRALTDEQVTFYFAEILISTRWRGQGLGQVLIEVCHRLYPSTRLDLLSTAAADGFYEANDFRQFEGFRKSYC